MKLYTALLLTLSALLGVARFLDQLAEWLARGEQVI